MGRNRALGWTVAALVVALLTPAVGGPAAAHDGGDHGEERAAFRVGAAAVDVTPPLAGAGCRRPAHCPAPAGYDGPHLLTLEEPFQDANGNGRYDDGEPFQDCPVTRVDGTVAPPDGRWDGIYLGGGDCCDRRPTAVLDPIWARTIVVDNGDRRIAITSVDNEGVFKEYWDRVRAKVRADGVHLDEMFFSSTHDESAPDTIGISGPSELQSGVDPFYVEFLIDRSARSIEQAAADPQRASLRFGSVRPLDLTTCWSSYPFTADESIGVMQAVRPNGRVVATMVNYGIHAEELGFSDDDQDRLHLSSDWPHFAAGHARGAVRGNGDDDGGLGRLRRDAAGVPEPARPHADEPLLLGRQRRVPDDLHERRHPRSVRLPAVDPGRAGEAIARWAAWALATGSWSRRDTIRFRRDTYFVPLENALFALGGSFGVMPGKDGYVDGARSPATQPAWSIRTSWRTSSRPTSSGTASATPTS